jgi:membrane-bound lytic murein transglycosylase MltF
MPEAHQICPELYHFIAIRHQGNLVPGTKRQATSYQSFKQQAAGLRQIVARQFGELT